MYTPSVEGVVEDINFKSTKIRTFAQALVTMPNATLANDAITNPGKLRSAKINIPIFMPS
ncbi:MAG: mechanosensitive ion channel [Thermincola sp.]|nr:mechanosensitive ion channel [Thermincola sp.]